MSPPKRPLLSAPLEPPWHGREEAQCIILGPKRRVFCNARLRKILAALKEAATSEAPLNLRHRFWRRLGPTVSACLQSGQRTHGQFKLRVADQAVWVTLECRPLEREHRADRGCHCFISVRGLDELALNRPHGSRHEATIDRAHYPWPMLELDDRGRPLRFNTAAERFLGRGSPELLRHLELAVHPADWLTLQSQWQEALRAGRALQQTARLRVADQSYRNCIVRADPCLDDAGRLTRWVCTCMETREMAQAPEHVETEGVGNSFLTVASHELRTPLTSLQLNLQLALQRLQSQHRASAEPQSPIETMVTRSLKQTHRLIEVVSDILDASRIHHDKLELKHSQVNLHQVLLDTLALFDRPFAEVGCRVTVQVPDPIWGVWDRGRIEQVFFDLFANVLKHAPGSHVAVSAELQGDAVAVRVADDGPGIPARLHEQIFGRFGRAAECRGISGLGLGLYLCRRIVADHGGTMSVQSQEGAGTAFVVSLPVTVPQMAQQPRASAVLPVTQNPASVKF